MLELIIKRTIIFILLVPIVSVAAEPFWECIAHDKANKPWVGKNAYQKMAINLSFAACKKGSQYPETCRITVNNCTGYHLGLSSKPFWHCAAFDQSGAQWMGNYYTTKDDAAMAAKEYCQSKSSTPGSCYVNMIACTNINEGS
jgi:hypothetical protein